MKTLAKISALIILLALTAAAVVLGSVKASAEPIEYLPGDVNGDGAVNVKDLIRLAQYIAKWDVELYSPELHLHDLTKYPAVEATCTEPGNIEYYQCSVCGGYFIYRDDLTKVSIEDTVIPAKGHKWDEGSVTSEPTCSSIGETTFTCTGCGITRTEDIAPIPHNFVDNICTMCGEERSSQGLEFILNDDNESYTLAGMGTCTDTEIYVPAKYAGKPVTAIGERAFADQTSVTEIIIPGSVKTIGTRAFYNTGLTEITIPESVTSIGTQIIYKANGLTTVYYNSPY
ncbi:MAG: leucine-rich repeat protein, partial [Clostridia bacterium]|nr:leucine-rich repeat protein [Clostridia bacterium]